MAKRILCALLALFLFAGLAACTGTAAPSSAPPSVTQTPTATALPSEDPVEIRMFGVALNQSPDLPKVVEAVNKISLEKINTTFNWTTVNFSAFSEQVNLWLAAQEPYDLFWSGTMLNYANQVSKGYLAPMEDLMEQYGQDIKSVLGDYATAARTADGHIYGVTTRRDLSSGYGFEVDKALIEKYKLDLSKVKYLEDMEPIIAEMKKNEPTMTMVHGGGAGSVVSPLLCFPKGNYYTYDDLGNSDDGVAVINPANNTTASLIFESPVYLEGCRIAREWFKKGYFLKDVASTTTTGKELLKAGQLFVLLNSMKAGEDGQTYNQTGREVEDFMVIEPYANSTSAMRMVWSIPIFSKHPESAMKFLNLMFADADVVNLLCWGIEGEHYVKMSDGHIRYPDGVTAQTVKYNPGVNWMMGDQFKSYVWEGTSLDVWKEQDEMNKTATKSKAFGFIFDSSNVKTEVAAVNSIIIQYRSAAEYGAIDPDKIVPEFNSKMREAGAEKVLAEKQKQLDAWLAVNAK